MDVDGNVVVPNSITGDVSNSEYESLKGRLNMVGDKSDLQKQWIGKRRQAYLDKMNGLSVNSNNRALFGVKSRIKNRVPILGVVFESFVKSLFF